LRDLGAGRLAACHVAEPDRVGAAVTA